MEILPIMKLNDLQFNSNLAWIALISSIALSGCVTVESINAQAAANSIKSYETAKRNGLAAEQCMYARVAMTLFLQANDDGNLKKWKAISETDCVPQATEVENSGRIGVQLAAIPRDVQQRLERNRGLFVAAVTVGSPAFRANILVGDVITAVNGKSCLI